MSKLYGYSFAGAVAVTILVADFFYQLFGKNNAVLFGIIHIAIVVEWITLLLVAGISPVAQDDMDFKKTLRFWLERLLMLCLIAVGMGLDFALFFAGDPVTISVEYPRRATKIICLGIFLWQMKEIAKNVLKIWKDFPLAVLAIRLIDRTRIAAVDEESKPETFTRRWYDKPEITKEPFKDILDCPPDCQKEPEPKKST